MVGGPACCYFFKLAIFFFPSSRYVFFLLLFAFDRLMNKKRTDGHFSNWKQISYLPTLCDCYLCTGAQVGTRMGVRICFVIVIVYSTSFVHLVLSHGAPRDPPSLESRLLPLSAAPHPLPRLLWFWECSSQRLVRHLVQWCLTVLRTSVLRKQKNRVTRNPF